MPASTDCRCNKWNALQKHQIDRFPITIHHYVMTHIDWTIDPIYHKSVLLCDIIKCMHIPHKLQKIQPSKNLYFTFIEIDRQNFIKSTLSLVSFFFIVFGTSFGLTCHWAFTLWQNMYMDNVMVYVLYINAAHNLKNNLTHIKLIYNFDSNTQSGAFL